MVVSETEYRNTLTWLVAAFEQARWVPETAAEKHREFLACAPEVRAAIDAGIAAARELLDRQPFRAPAVFPVLARTRDGSVVHLLGRFGQSIVGVIPAVDDRSAPDLRQWDQDGLLYGADDADPLDLVVVSGAQPVYAEQVA